MRPIYIRGGKVLLDHGLEETDLRLEDGRIAELGPSAPAGATVIDARGLIVAPALIDIHGDAFERQMMPRPGVFFPLDVALADTDRQLAANGICTAYHALTMSWEPGLRAVGQGAGTVDTLDALAPRLAVDHRLQLRWETFCFEAEPLIDRVLAGPATPALAFNDHTSMSLRSFDVPVQERAFEQSPAFALADWDDPRLETRLSRHAHRAGLDNRAYIDLLREVWTRRDTVPEVIARIAAKARARGVPMLSHDDTQEETRNYYRPLGASIAEFPMREPVALAARKAGDHIVFGAPNVVRGGSHLGASPGAADMVEKGLCDILASDYYYPAMLAAVSRLVADKRADLPRAWALVAGNPARALGLSDRGRIETGLRADLAVVEWPEAGTPLVRAAISAGRVASLCGDLLA